MKIRSLLIIPLVFGLHIQAQDFFPDTIPANTPFSRTKGNYIVENTVDTAITVVINEIMASNDGGYLDEYEDDDDWIEIYNYGDKAIPLNRLYFSDRGSEPFKWAPHTDIEIQPGEFRIIWADNEPEQGIFHANFKLSSDGESIYLHHANSTKIDQVYYPEQSTNIAYGRTPDAGLTWNYFEEATPAEANSNEGSLSVLPKPTANLQGGIYKDTQTLRLATSIQGATIRYTTDGKAPKELSNVLTEDLQITETTIIKARSFKDDAICSPVLTLSFIYTDLEFENPVISLVGHPGDFFGTPGLFENNAQDIEIPTNMEFFVKGKTEFNSGAGLQIHSSKIYEPKSVRLYARARYGENWFNYRFFQNEGVAAYKRLVLRNSGNDNVNRATTNVHFRDAFIHQLAEHSNEDPWTSKSRPINVFLNGEYYGMLNLRERIDEYYIQSYSGEDDVNLLERAFGYPGNQHAIIGEQNSYNDLIAYIDKELDSSTEEGYQFISEQISISNFTDYWLTEVFIGNFDWLSNNMKFWKPTNGGKWRWIYWDTDHGIGLKFGSYGYPNWNTLSWSLSNADRTWDGKHNRLLRSLLKNEEYKAYFIKRYSALLNTRFDKSYTLPLFNSMASHYKNDLQHHYQRWNREEDDWNTACETIRQYLFQRPQIQLDHLQEYFDLPDPVDVRIQVFPEQSAEIEIEGLTNNTDDLDMQLFPGFNYKVKIHPSAGYGIDHWSINDLVSDSAMIDFSTTHEVIIYLKPVQLDSLFELSEIYYNTKDSFDSGEWIEAYYGGNTKLDISNYYLSNDGNHYQIPKGSKLHAESYFILAENTEAFTSIYPNTANVIGNFPLFQGESDSLFLHSSNGDTLLHISFEEGNDWPSLSSEGYSIERKSFEFDASIGTSWEKSENEFGSPEKTNDVAYHFTAPIGKSLEFPNDEAKELSFADSDKYYFDDDKHPLGGLWIEHMEGPGIIFFESSSIAVQNYYPAGNLLFTPGGPSRDTTILQYKFLDATGEASDLHQITFRAPNVIQEKEKERIQLFPNPAKDYCIIELDGMTLLDCRIDMYNASGQVVSNYSVSRNVESVVIDTQSLNAGIYYIQLMDGQHVYRAKMILTE